MVKAANPALPSTSKAMDDATPVLSKRARHRRRRHFARQLAKARESKDGVRYTEDFKSRQQQEQQLRITNPSSKTETNEGVGVKSPSTSKWVWLSKPEPVPQTQEGEVAARIPSKPDPVPSTEPGNEGDHSKPSFPLKGRLGPLSVNRGRVPIKERLGPLKGPQVANQTGGRINSPKKDDKGETPITDRIGLRVEVKEPVQFLCSQKRKFERATFEKANQATHPRMKPHSSDEGGIIQGNTCQHSMGGSHYQTNELYYRAGGMEKPRKGYVQDTKKFRRGSSQYFSPDQPAEAFPYTARLQTGAISRKDYRRVPKGLSPEGEATDTDSDSCSAVASDDMRKPYESLMIRAKRVNKLLEEALAKRKKGSKFEAKMAVQQMREKHDQQVAVLTIHQGEPVFATTNGSEYGQLAGAGTITTIPTSAERTQQEPLHQDVQNPMQSQANQQVGRDKLGNSDNSYHFDVMTQLANIPVEVTLQELSQLSKSTREAFTITPDQLTQIVQEALIKQKEEFDAKMEAAMQQIKGLQVQERQLESSCYTMPIMPIPNRTSDNGPNLDMVIKTDSPLGNTRGGMTSPFDEAGGGSIPSSQHRLARSEENQKEVEPVTSPVRRYPKRKKAEGSQLEFRPRSADFNRSWRRLLRERYSFKDDDVPDILEYLLENDKIKLPPIKDQEEASQISDPKYCGYHRRIIHPTKGCFALKKNIQALIEVGVSIAEQTE